MISVEIYQGSDGVSSQLLSLKKVSIFRIAILSSGNVVLSFSLLYFDLDCIFRFDLYHTLIQYIQSRGRARHMNSKVRVFNAPNRVDLTGNSSTYI